MEIIAHKINSIKSLKKLPKKYGSEVDLRTFGSKIVLSHDPYIKGDKLEDYLENYNHGTLILNIKESGIEKDVIRKVRNNNVKLISDDSLMEIPIIKYKIIFKSYSPIMKS